MRPSTTKDRGKAGVCGGFGTGIQGDVAALRPRFVSPWTCAIVLVTCLTGCEEEKPAPPSSPVPTAATATASGPTTVAAAPDESGPPCEPMNRELWSEKANLRTGITAKHLPDGRLVVGVGVKNIPYVVEYDDQGKGGLRRLHVDPGDPIDEPPKEGEGVRHLQRVSPTAKGYFVDYRDKYRNGRRRIACGMLNREPYVVFDGTPLLDVDTSGAKPGDQPLPDRARRIATIKAKPLSREAKRELRDCRTMSDPTGEDVFAVGSELVGEQVDGATEWYMDFFVKTVGGQTERILLQRNALGTAPKKLYTLEAPVSHKLDDGSYIVAGRYRGTLIAWLLDTHKKKTSVLHRYTGGYPSLPRIVHDDDRHLLLTSKRVGEEQWAIHWMPLGQPAELLERLIALDGGEPSRAEPTVARLGDQRWLSYHAGSRRHGRIHVVPVDESLKPIGAAHPITPEGSEAYESHLFALAKRDWLLSVYISRPGPDQVPELRGHLMKCAVRK